MIWLVRHGESTANAGHATSDYAAIPLTALGLQQAEAVALACTTTPTWIASSMYLRAKQSAEPLLSRYPECSLTTLPVHEFTFLGAERCSDMDTAARQPMVDEYWSRMDPSYCDGDGAESFTCLWSRVQRFLQFARRRRGLGIVFTHEQFIRAALLATVLRSDESSVMQMQRFFALRSCLPIPNGAVVRLAWVRGRWWVCGVDTTHLLDIGGYSARKC
jgi:broad specificity phosphatase PhoE